jgi:hypothetical protein
MHIKKLWKSVEVSLPYKPVYRKPPHLCCVDAGVFLWDKIKKHIDNHLDNCYIRLHKRKREPLEQTLLPQSMTFIELGVMKTDLQLMRKTRTLIYSKIPLDIRRYIRECRQDNEVWQETAIRLIGEHEKLVIEKALR